MTQRLNKLEQAVDAADSELHRSLLSRAKDRVNGYSPKFHFVDLLNVPEGMLLFR